jgi:DNA-binding MarR family transcriptional regulator
MPPPFPERAPLILLVNRADRALQADMVRQAHELGYPQVKHAHNAVFGALGGSGARATDLAVRAGITRQSMGEIVRDLVGLGFVTMEPDPLDRRAKLVKYTPAGVELTNGGFQHILDLEERFAEEFGAERYEQVRDVLARVVQLLEPDPDPPQ